MQEDLIKVLWVENDPTVTGSYPIEAENFDLQLVPFDCWDDAEAELKKNASQWDAIILDAKCKHHKDSADSASRFLIHVFPSLERIYNDNNRVINWYVLSGGSETEISDLIPEGRLQWDKDWEKSYYSKNTDREALYQRIKEQVKTRSNETQIKTRLYKDVFDAIDELQLGDDAANSMVRLLEPIHFEGTKNQDYNDRMYEARKSLEFVFRSMIKNGILPDNFRVVTSGKDQVNETYCSLFLAGDPARKLDYPNLKPIVPRIVSECMKNMLYIVGSSLHTTEEKQRTEMNTQRYLDSVGSTSYLLKSFALQLCDLILWYRGYSRKHSDFERNKQVWNSEN